MHNVITLLFRTKRPIDLNTSWFGFFHTEPYWPNHTVPLKSVPAPHFCTASGFPFLQ